MSANGRRPKEVVAAEYWKERSRFPDDQGRNVKCHENPAEYQDYPNSDAPTDAEAREMCKGCPFNRMLCREYGMTIGGEKVWGGAVLVDGKLRRAETERKAA